MFALVRWYVDRWDTGAAETWTIAAVLFSAMALGVAVYTGTVMVLWFASGRPEGVELRLLTFLRTRLVRRFA